MGGKVSSKRYATPISGIMGKTNVKIGWVWFSLDSCAM